ncbi:sulfatase [Pelagicoccus sp. SDUM812005]|uniref:sulfatase n=1 Tax=Pelagicoccus sp. SDUM812005 TaxID=3041257 RepID=UPI00280F2068|nr:sulfatase [Pelagicoccus sp. SDUM812005]MDQ8183155.1 sulfatase [Pelagicoccus sp. SDUM812005]
MRKFALLLTVLASALSLKAAVAEPVRPNVLFIAIDDLRPELGCYGDPVAQTPHLDKLAGEGALFERAYCQVAVCGASRASMMTGILPTKTRFVDYLATVDGDAPGAATLAQVFKEAGYTTLVNGKIFHNSRDTAERSWSEKPRGTGLNHRTSHDPQTNQTTTQQGNGLFFECVAVPDDAYTDGRVAARTIEDLRRFKDSGEPFFIGCGFIRPHLPFYAPKKYWDLYDANAIPLASYRDRPRNAPDALSGSGEYRTYFLGDYDAQSEAFHRKMRHGYLASTSYVDKLVGDVLNELDALGLADNTIVVVWGDHGFHLGEYNFWGKHNTMHLATRIPLIVKAPGKLQGLRSEALISSVDIFPTLCALAGIETPASVQGKSFVASLSDKDATSNAVVYTRFKSADAIVTPRFNYTRYENGEEMLYDLKIDPGETLNRVSNPEYKATLAKLRILLQEQIEIAESAPF